ncbi:hypothetical protein E8D34_00035 [Nocardioides sp. GY 10113]|uniref:hypothetical protein n=1 Tax=Nocardioides sp. GY 10113 TaxID=2569761 RepID=UPI0010A7D96C|nr:hypothetical protein [Nocardioides sp. GY 10113]TIC88961.1 hypothetical protein E8D34_00035 [Nocardioides sp. GY 10113]
MPIDPYLLQRVVASTGLSEAEATRVIGDVIAFHQEPIAELVRRRHAELQARGIRNAEIYPLLRAELAERVVAAPDLSDRQLRRLVYG